MSDLYLIAHKVRGEPAFDVAQKLCEGQNGPCQENCGLWKDGECLSKDIWIIPTSGHRAWPYWHMRLLDLGHRTVPFNQCLNKDHEDCEVPPMPEGLRDHYEVTRETPQSGEAKIMEIDLAELDL